MLLLLLGLEVKNADTYKESISFNNHQTGKFTSIKSSCHQTSCAKSELENKRTIVSDYSTSYFCDLNGYLYIIKHRESHQVSFKQENVRCSYNLEVVSKQLN